jgi:phage terminase large subunit-like protein
LGNQPGRSDDPVTTWAENVLAGRVVAGNLVGCAAERHMRDLRDGPGRGLFWDLPAALHVINWYPSWLTITAGAKAGKPFDLLPPHMFAAGSIFGWKRANGRRRFRTFWFETGKGQGKALALDTPIPTPGGWSTMGALRDGDEIFDEAGNVCRVLKAHDVLHGQKCFRLTFDDGESIVADAGHLWPTEMRNSGSSDHGSATRGVPLTQRGKWRFGIRSTQQIADTLRYKNGKYQSVNHSIRLAGALNLPDADLPIDPYVLGFWLGDGDSDGARVTIGERDIEESRANLAGVGAILGKRSSSERCGRYSVNIGRLCRDGLLARLMRLDLLKNKHIPAEYLRGSIDQRLALLQGLMDTDGTVANGQCSFCNMNKRLAYEFLDLVVSLGLKATIHSKSAKISSRVVGVSYHVCFYAPAGFPVFRLTRKQAGVAPLHSCRRLSGERRIVECEKVPSVPVRCITASSDSKLFLAGRSMIPTHNTPFFAATGIYMLRFCGIPRFEGYAVAGNENQSGLIIKDAAEMVRAPVPSEVDDEVYGPSVMEKAGLLLRGTGDLTWQVEWDGSEYGLGTCKFRNVSSGSNISGPRPSLVLCDEVHEWDDPSILEMWQAAIDKAPGDPLMMLGTNTPALDQTFGTEQSNYYTAVAKGEYPDDSSLSLIFTCDEDDKPLEDESVWRKSLPALDITFPADNIRDRVNRARGMPSEEHTLLRLYFGKRVGALNSWINADVWKKVVRVIKDEEVAGLPCWYGLDLSSRIDLTALCVVWKLPDGHFLARIFYWTPEASMRERGKLDGGPYELWAQQGHLIAVPGYSIGKDWPATKLKELHSSCDSQALAYDPAQILDFEEAAREIGLDMWLYEGPDTKPGSGLMRIRHGQGFKGMDRDDMLSMPAGVKALQELILTERLTIDLNPVTNFCSVNMALQPGANPDQKVPTRRRSRGRIDGMVALIQAVNAAQSSICQKKSPHRSVYEGRGLMTV